MNINIQFLSFIYGVFVFFLFTLHWHYVRKLPFFLQCFFSVLLGLDIALLYIYLLFSINNGVFHLYFVFMLFLGIIFSFYCRNYVKYLKKTLHYKNK